MTKHIIVVGSINMDLVVYAPHQPQPGETILGRSFNTFPGGKGANQAVAAARLGGKVTLIGRVGADAFGDSLIKTLDKDKVETKFIIKDTQVSSGVAQIIVDDNGQNSIIVIPGANGKVSPEDILRSEEVFTDAALLLVQLECPVSVVTYAVNMAKRHVLQVVLNPAPAQLLNVDLLSKVDIIIPNQIELAMLASDENVSIAVKKLQKKGISCVIVTLGADGVLVVDHEDEIRIPAHRVTPIDTTAAGDAFIGAFSVAITEGLSIVDAARWGNAAGAVAVTRYGAQPSLPTRNEVLSMLNQPF